MLLASSWLDLTSLGSSVCFLLLHFCFVWKSHRNILRKCLPRIVLVCVCIVLFYASTNQSSYACRLLVHLLYCFPLTQFAHFRLWILWYWHGHVFFLFFFAYFTLLDQRTRLSLSALLVCSFSGWEKNEKLEIFFQKKIEEIKLLKKKKSAKFLVFFLNLSFHLETFSFLFHSFQCFLLLL